MVKNPPANTGATRDKGWISGSGRSHGGGNGNPLQDSCMENPMDGGVWMTRIHGVTKELETTEHDYVSCHQIFWWSIPVI